MSNENLVDVGREREGMYASLSLLLSLANQVHLRLVTWQPEERIVMRFKQMFQPQSSTLVWFHWRHGCEWACHFLALVSNFAFFRYTWSLHTCNVMAIDDSHVSPVVDSSHINHFLRRPNTLSPFLLMGVFSSRRQFHPLQGLKSASENTRFRAGGNEFMTLNQYSPYAHGLEASPSRSSGVALLHQHHGLAR